MLKALLERRVPEDHRDLLALKEQPVFRAHKAHRVLSVRKDLRGPKVQLPLAHLERKEPKV